MTPAEFIKKWGDSRLRERQGSHEHFIDLCRMLGEPTPAEDDPLGERYCFERGAEKVGGGDGWADVWRRGCFGWEYKGKRKDLNAALRQLQAYTLDLENPPYLVVSDMERIIVHTNWTNTVSTKYEFGLRDLYDPERVDDLRAVFQGSDRLKPGVDRRDLTAKAAATFGELSRRLQDRGNAPREVAHFLNRLIFCMFAEDAGLLPLNLFSRTVKATAGFPDDARRQLSELFSRMRTGGFFGPDVIRWFNGGLFDDENVLRLEFGDLEMIAKTASEDDWSEIDPAIFGTLFEQALKATRERPALGAHYTDREKILKIVEPVIVRPLIAEWEETKTRIAVLMADAVEAEAAAMKLHGEARTRTETLPASGGPDLLGGVAFDATEVRKLRSAGKTFEQGAVEARTNARSLLEIFQQRLANFRVLDPACGSGNFLYVALHELRDLEQRAVLDAARMGLPTPPLIVDVDVLRGVEIEPYAAELARVTLWIGNLQWLIRRGYRDNLKEPLLSQLDQIENRDALLDKDGTEAAWPYANVIIGNPPFVGGKRLRDSLGDTYVERLFDAYRGRVPAEADLVAYWVEKAWREIGEPSDQWQFGQGRKVGLVTTNSIRGGANRKVLSPIAEAHAIREAWPDEPWVLDGAAVRVSMIGFGWGFPEQRVNGFGVDQINADLTGAIADLTKARRLKENAGVAFMGDTKGGAFDVPGDLARTWLKLPLNPNGRPNSDVLKPWRNGMDVTRRPADKWIIDFGWTMSEAEAALYEAPFRHVVLYVEPERRRNKRESYRESWWRHVEPRQGMWKAIGSLPRVAVTPRVAKHRVFVWQSVVIAPDSQLIVIARGDDTTLGVLHSRFHELWALRLGTWLGVGNDPRYTPSTTFETFPFPEGMTPDKRAMAYVDDPRATAIAEAARDLIEKREAWLNPPDLIRVEPEVVPGYPDRVMPRGDAAEKVLKTRTLTNLYNERPAWLQMAHRRLDEAVAVAYGWPAGLSDDEVLERLFGLNQEREAAGR